MEISTSVVETEIIRRVNVFCTLGPFPAFELFAAVVCVGKTLGRTTRVRSFSTVVAFDRIRRRVDKGEVVGLFEIRGPVIRTCGQNGYESYRKYAHAFSSAAVHARPNLCTGRSLYNFPFRALVGPTKKRATSPSARGPKRGNSIARVRSTNGPRPWWIKTYSNGHEYPKRNKGRTGMWNRERTWRRPSVWNVSAIPIIEKLTRPHSTRKRSYTNIVRRASPSSGQ